MLGLLASLKTLKCINYYLMEVFFVIAVMILITIMNFAARSKAPKSTKAEYIYEAKQYIMTKSESDFFKRLNDILQDKYYVFPQIHLSAILKHDIPNGQKWRVALNKIDRKSVDFVICDKVNQKILLAIELDDSSHDRPDRVIRDTEVESMLEKAGIKLLRFRLNTPEQEIRIQLNAHVETSVR